MNNYKKNEIKLLKKINNKVDISIDNDYENIKKFILINTNKFPISITNNGTNKNYKFDNKNISYFYTYSRFDGYINYATMLQDFYCVKRNNYKTKVFFTNSGMSAISSVLYSIDLMYKDYDFVFYKDDIYFEAYDYINKCLKSIRKNSNNKILYIDTICKKYNENEIYNLDFKNIKLIIFDTTCFIASEMKKIIDFLICKNIPIVLVRSHTKLDMLGSELTSMGSIIYIIPNSLNDEYTKNIIELIRKNFYILGKFNSLLSINNFYEIIFNKNFIKTNNERIKLIEDNNEKLYLYLKNKYQNIKLILPTHKKFLLFLPTKNYNSVNEQLEKYKKLVCAFCNKKREIFYSGSFGFDYVSMDVYFDLNLSNFVIRISMNNSDKLESIFNDIGEFVNDNI